VGDWLFAVGLGLWGSVPVGLGSWVVAWDLFKVGCDDDLRLGCGGCGLRWLWVSWLVVGGGFSLLIVVGSGVGCGGWQGWVWVAGKGGFVLRCSKYTM
jgi:hypothetical protein